MQVVDLSGEDDERDLQRAIELSLLEASGESLHASAAGAGAAGPWGSYFHVGPVKPFRHDHERALDEALEASLALALEERIARKRGKPVQQASGSKEPSMQQGSPCGGGGSGSGNAGGGSGGMGDSARVAAARVNAYRELVNLSVGVHHEYYTILLEAVEKLDLDLFVALATSPPPGFPAYTTQGATEWFRRCADDAALFAPMFPEDKPRRSPARHSTPTNSFHAAAGAAPDPHGSGQEAHTMSKDHASSYGIDEASRQKPPNVIKLVGLEQFFKSRNSLARAMWPGGDDRDVRPVGREMPGAEAAVAAGGSGTRVGTAREAAAAGRAAAAAAVAKTTTVTSGRAAAASGPRDQLLAGGGADTAAAASKGPAIGLGTAGASAGAAARTSGGYGGEGNPGERDRGAPWDDADAAGSRTKRRRKDTVGSGGSGGGSPLDASYVSGSPAAACAATGTRRGAGSSMLTPLALHPSQWQPGSLPMSILPSNTPFWKGQDGTMTYPGNRAGLEPATQHVASQGTGPEGAKCALWALGGGSGLSAGGRSGAQKRLGRFGGGGGGPGSGGCMTGPGGDAARADEVPDGRDATGADARWSGYEDDELMYWFQDPVDDCDGVDTHMRWDDAPGRGRAGALGLDRWGEGGALHTRAGMPTPGGAAAKAGEASPGSDQSTLTIEAIGEFATMSAVDAAGMWRFEIEEAARKLWPLKGAPPRVAWCQPGVAHPPLRRYYRTQKVLWRSDERTHEATVAKIDHRSVPPLYTLDLSRSYSFETNADSTAHAMLLCLQPFDKVWVRLRLPQQQQQQQQQQPGSEPGGAGGFNGEAEAFSGGAEGLQAHAGEPGSRSKGGRAGSESGSEGTKDLAAGAEATCCAATAATVPGFSPNLVWEEAWVVGVDASYPDPEVWLLTACPMERSVLWPYLPPAMRAAAGSGNGPGGSVEVDLDEEGAYGAVGQVEQEGQDPDCIVVGTRRGGRGSGGQAPLALCVRMSDIDLRHAVGECSSAAPGIGGRCG